MKLTKTFLCFVLATLCSALTIGDRANATPLNNPISAGLLVAYEFSGNADDSSGNGNRGVKVDPL